MNTGTTPRNFVSGISLFAILMIVVAIVDYVVGLPPNVLRAAIVGSAISALAVTI